MAHRHKVHQRARGGGVAKKGVEVYSGAGSNVASEAESKKDSFKKGGRKHHVGRAFGGRAPARADRRARGGKIGGKSPFSSAAHGEDHKRSVHTKDSAMPRKDGGRLVQFWAGGRTKSVKQGFKHGGRPHHMGKHHMNFGNHKGAGHEEPHEHHLPIHHKHGGKTHRKDGGKVVGSAGDRP